MRYSKGICWVDDTRIPFKDEENINFNSLQKAGKVYRGDSYTNSITDCNTPHYKTQGRFTPNLLVCDDALNDGVISQNNKTNKEWSLDYDYKSEFKIFDIKKVGVSRFNDKGSNSRYYDLDLWFNHLINKL